MIGAQWGDEGKGKIVDLLAEHYDVVARASGGANAGHTIVVQGKKHVFHLLPSGCFHGGKDVVLGSGMVIHLPTLLSEIRTLKESGIDIVERLFISSEAHIVFDYHREVDAALEQRRSERKGQGLGTTRRGIGPAYIDKAGRQGIRMEHLGEDLRAELSLRVADLEQMYGVSADVEREMEQLKEAAAVLKHRIVDTVDLLYEYLSAGKRIIIEGAQGALLDLDHGTYPYVTSSSTTLPGALQGLGIPPQVVTSCLGVVKAYCTRVGSGTFETEAEDTVAGRLRERGGEYGATTGRPRRCGWIYLPHLRRAVRTNGVTHWAITKLDVLDGEEVIHVGTGEKKGHIVYRDFPGWKEPTEGCTKFQDLPKNAVSYLEFLQSETRVPIALIGTGPGRDEVIVHS